MSAGQSTYFCKKGHIVYDTMEDEVGYENFIKECDFCGSSEVKGINEWYDEDYHINKHGEYNSIVPHEPIGEDEKKCEDHRGNTYYTIVQVYDVSELFDVS